MAGLLQPFGHRRADRHSADARQARCKRRGGWCWAGSGV